MLSDESRTYDAGLLGGGHLPAADWWHDYIRAELGRSHDFYAQRLDDLLAEIDRLKAELNAAYERAAQISEVTPTRYIATAIRNLKEPT
jgi:hypothetical protein